MDFVLSSQMQSCEKVVNKRMKKIINIIIVLIDQKNLQHSKMKNSIFESTKQNLTLTRQGRSFRVNLNQSNGAFLPKDITQTNQSSISLLAAKQVLSSQQKTCEVLKNITKYQQSESKMLRSTHIENAFGKISLMKGENEIIERQLVKLKNERKQIKNSFGEVKERVEEQNNVLLEENLPYLKKLSRLIKDQNSLQKNLNDETKRYFFCLKRRQIESLSNFKNKFLDRIIKCEALIINIENYLGFMPLNIKDS